MWSAMGMVIFKMPFDQLKKPKPEDPTEGFEAAEENGIVPRDKRGWPKIWTPDGSKRVSYARPSGLGSVLEDASNLIPWAQGRVAIGAIKSPELLDELKRAGDMDWNSDKGKALARKIGEQLAISGGSERASEIGTQRHEIFEQVDHGNIPKSVPEDFRPYLDAYVALLERMKSDYQFQMIDTEVFGVNDDLKIGGSLDMIGSLVYNGSQRVAIFDKKTSRTLEYSMGKFIIQLWAYANMVRYSPHDALHKIDKYGLGVGRSPLHVGDDDNSVEVDQDVAFIQHVPSDRPLADLVPMPISYGRAGFDLASLVKEWRNQFKRKAMQPKSLIEIDMSQQGDS